MGEWFRTLYHHPLPPLHGHKTFPLPHCPCSVLALALSCCRPTTAQDSIISPNPLPQQGPPGSKSFRWLHMLWEPKNVEKENPQFHIFLLPCSSDLAQDPSSHLSFLSHFLHSGLLLGVLTKWPKRRPGFLWMWLNHILDSWCIPKASPFHL